MKLQAQPDPGERPTQAVENELLEPPRLDSRKIDPSSVALPRLGYSVNETGQILGISAVTVYRLLERGLLKSATGLRTKVIALKEIERFLNN